MAKEIKGWRTPNSWDYNGDDLFQTVLSKSIQSDDGWLCPYCDAKETMESYEMNNREAMELVFGHESVEIHCNHCDKKYFVRCFTRFLYSSCEDNKFED